MSSFILEIAMTAGQALAHPAALIIPALMILALLTGVAGRVAVIIEDARHGPKIGEHNENDTGISAGPRSRRRS